MTDAADQLGVEAVEEIDAAELPDADALDFEQLGPLVEVATEVLESVSESDDPAAHRVRTLLRLVDLIRGVLQTSDADELLNTVDFDELDSVVDAESLPDALESGELGDAVELRNLSRLVEFGQLWQTVDLGELLDSRDEITESVGELTGSEGGSPGSDLLADVELEDFTGGDDESALGGLTDPELIQASAQARLDSAVDGFQEVLIETHAHLDELREANARRFDGVDQPHSRNPTAVSLATTHHGPPKDTTRVSTVPRSVRHSTGPSRRRIYGPRFERLVAEKRGEPETETDEADAGTDGTDGTTDTAAEEVDADE